MSTLITQTAGRSAFQALCDVARIAVTARTMTDLANQALGALRDSGLIADGLVEIDSGPHFRSVFGSDAAHLLEYSASNDGSRNIAREALPTRASSSGCLILVYKTPPPDGFTTAVAEQLALGLDRIQLLDKARELTDKAERRIQEVSTIYEIGRAIDRVEISRLLDIITEKAAKVMDAQACSLMRLDADTHQLTIAASFGLSDDVVFVTQRALGEGIAGRVAQTGEPMLIADAQSDPRLIGLSLRADIGSSMIVPMKDEQGRVIGVLSIRRRSPAPDFDQDALRLFSVFASQAALAITNAQLYSDLRRRVNELSTLSNLTQSVISTLDLGSLLEVVADRISEVVKFDRCAIFIMDRGSKRLSARVLRGYRPDVVGRNPVRLGEGVIGIVAKKQMPIVESDARNAMQPMRGFARALGTNAFIAIPIIAKGQAIGVVVADNRPSGRLFHAADIELLTTFVGQAGLAIENAQLYEDRELRYQEMNRLATQTDNILRSIPTAVAVIDTAGHVTRWNKAAEELWNVTEHVARDSTYGVLVDRFGLPEDEGNRLQEMMRNVSETGRADHVFKLLLHPKRRSEIIVNLFVSPLIDRQGERQGAVQIMEDVTREIRMEVEMARIRRLADIGQLAAKMAHEVRNPLSSIKGAAQLMRNEYAELAPLREFLDIIVDEVNGLSKITTELLDFARPMQLDLRWCSLNGLVDRSLTLMSAELSEYRVMVRFEPADRLPKILVDGKQIEQVIRNVLLNAAQAMPNGGEVLILTSHDPMLHTVTVQFCDEGEGIAEDRLEEIFQPFVTSKTKGTGLGLPIVRKIVENHGGQIAVKSRVSHGTEFAITLPIRPMVSETTTRTRIMEPPLRPTIPDV